MGKKKDLSLNVDLDLEEEKLPRSFFWLLGALGALFVLFLLTEPFYR